MEIHNQRNVGSTHNVRQVYEGHADITRPNRDAISETTDPLRFDNADRVEFSERARLLASQADGETQVAEDKARAQRVAEMRAALENGSLNSDERVERAAQALLAGGRPSEG